jgi:hypothetical protein
MAKEKKYVTKEEFEKLEIGVNAILEKLSAAPVIEAPTQTPTVMAPEVKDDEPDIMNVPPAWRKIVDEVLGSDFGLNVVYPDKGSGFMFKIIVPKEKSNASQSHWEFYKTDVRTKAISYSDGIDGVKLYCEKVARNLGIKKNING